MVTSSLFVLDCFQTHFTASLKPDRDSAMLSVDSRGRNDRQQLRQRIWKVNERKQSERARSKESWKNAASPRAHLLVSGPNDVHGKS